MSDELDPKPAPVQAGVDATANAADGTEIKAAEPAKQPSVDDVARLVLEQVKAEILTSIRASRPAAPAPAIHVASKPSATDPAVVEASLCLAGGLRDIEKHFDAKTLEAADKRRSDAGLQTLLLNAAKANGWSGHDRTVTAGNCREVMRYAFRVEADGGFATHSISNVLAATYGKFALQGFNSVESTFQEISTVRNVNDFKTVTGVRLNGGFEFEQVGPSGELKSADASDETRTLKADLYGRLTSASMVDIINDDLGVLSVIPSRLGRGAATRRNKVFWTAFELNNSTYYQAASPAAGNALQYSSLVTATTNYRKVTDPDGNPLGITPRILLVPPDLEIAAGQLMTQSALIASSLGSTSSKVVEPQANVLAGRYRVVVSTYLTSASTWWLMADPMDLSPMEVAYVNGQTAPVVQQAEADFNTLGIQFRGYWGFGVAKAESRAAYRMATA